MSIIDVNVLPYFDQMLEHGGLSFMQIKFELSYNQIWISSKDPSQSYSSITSC